MTAIGMAKEALLTQEELKRQLNYDPKSGIFTRIISKSGCCIGRRAGTLMRGGYVMICINQVNYLAHRLAWLYTRGQWPVVFIDHINRIRSDNRIENLREATNSQNKANGGNYRKMYSHLPKGVTWRRHGKFAAQIRHNQKTIHLGHFDNITQAEAAYKEASLRLQGEFSTHRSNHETQGTS